MKKIPKRLYVFLAINIIIATAITMVVSAQIHTPEIFEDIPTEKKVIHAEKFIFETESYYSSHSELCSVKAELDQYAEKYKTDMFNRQEKENVTMRDYNKQYQKYDIIREEIDSKLVELEPSEQEKIKLKETFFYDLNKGDKEKEDIIKDYENGIITIDEAMEKAGNTASLDELYEEDYKIFCMTLSEYNMLGWYNTPAGHGYEKDRINELPGKEENSHLEETI